MKESHSENIACWNKISAFIERHRSAFSDFELMRIKNIILYGTFPANYYIDLIREICDEFNLIPDEENMYIAFLKELEETYDIKTKNIIEVGGGMIPCLGRRINLIQTTGSITVYDPRLLECYESGKGFRLVRDEFTYKTDLEDANLLIGLMPCKGAEVLVDQAIKNKIDFMVWLCEGGPHGDYYDFYEDEEEWLYSVISCAARGVRDKNMGEFRKKYIKRFSQEYPIISSRKIN